MNYTEFYINQFKDTEYSNHHNFEEPRYVYARSKLPKDTKFSLIDVGSGRGVFLSLMQKEFNGVDLYSADLSKFNSLVVPFIEYDLSKPQPLKNRYDYLTCLDVLEHLKEEHLDIAIDNLKQLSDKLILSVAHISDRVNGIERHLTIRPFKWWMTFLEKNFIVHHFSSLFKGTATSFTLTTKSLTTKEKE